MSRKIGEELIQRGLLRREQLEHALQTQLLRGGHLGTSLVELGFVDEAALGKTLASIHGVSYAAKPLFEEIPQSILDSLPRDFVVRRQVIPVGLENGELHVAMIRPRSLANISGMTGYKVIPYIAPEGRILAALERYYGVPRRQRFVGVSGGFKKEPAAAASGEKPAQEAPVLPDAIAELSRRLGRVEARWELAETLLDHASQTLERCILFEVDKDSARIVGTKGVELADDVLESTLPVTVESVFGLVLEDVFFRGAVPSSQQAPFFQHLHMRAPREAVVLPIYGEERLEAVLYGDPGGDGTIPETDEFYLMMSERVELAMRMLSFKQQLAAPSA